MYPMISLHSTESGFDLGSNCALPLRVEQHLPAIPRELQVPGIFELFEGKGVGNLPIDEIATLANDVKYPVDCAVIPVPGTMDREPPSHNILPAVYGEITRTADQSHFSFSTDRLDAE